MNGGRGERGERGARGEAGVAGRQGEAGVAGGEGRPGKTGQEGSPGRAGENGPRGERGPQGPRARLRWAPAVGYGLLALFMLWGFLHERGLSERATRLERAQIEQVKHDCVDRTGDIAVRRQWKRVADIIERSRLAPTDKRHLDPKQASKLFAESYKQALKEAGPVPPCIGAG